MIKTDIARQYTKDCEDWMLRNNLAVLSIRQELQKLKQETEVKKEVFALTVDCYFVFHVERLITKNGKSEPVDVDNRLKPCLDAIKKILLIDDKHFYASHCEKLTTVSKDLECTMIRIEKSHPRTYDQIRSKMLQEVAKADS